jgi:uncharacterized membrane protein YdjX (TVP38/TMEM64 family)
LGLVLFALVLLLAWAGLGYLGRDRAVGWLQEASSAGPQGAVILVLIYTVAAVFLVPGSILTLAAGFTQGFGVGFVVASTGATLGAVAAFLVGRTLARELVRAKLAAHPRFEAFDRAVAREGLTMVLLTRLSPLFPYTVLNYAFSLTGVRFSHYLLGSWIGMLPGAAAYVYLGTAIQSLAQPVAGGSSPAGRALFWLGLVATLVVTARVTKIAREALQARMDAPAGS